MRLAQWLSFKLFQNRNEDHDAAQEQVAASRSSMPHSPRERAHTHQEENETKTVKRSTIFEPPHDQKLPFEGKIIQNRWVIGRKLGRGSFGFVSASYDKQTKQNCAVKMDRRKRNGLTSLEVEYMTYLGIFGTETPTGFIHPIKFVKTTFIDFLVLPLLGKTLGEFYREKEGEIGFKFVCNAGIQMLTRLEYVHSKGFLHLDVKPENMMLGTGDNAFVVYLIDFGLSKRYKDNSGEQKPYTTGHRFRGTRTLASVNVHAGAERAPRDDIESLFYCLILLQKGKLPWTDAQWGSNVHGTDILKMDDRILDMKRKHRRELCNGLPHSFQVAWRNVSKMRYDIEPDYSGLRNLLLTASQQYLEEGAAPASND